MAMSKQNAVGKSILCTIVFGMFYGGFLLHANPAVAQGPQEPSIRQAPQLVPPGDHGVGRYVPDVAFVNLDATKERLHSTEQDSLTVVAFTSTSCPISKKYLPTLVELAQEFSPQGVRFILVNCVATDQSDEMREAAARFRSPVSYAIDEDSLLANHFGALSTTDIFLLDRSHTVIYHGAIDDQYGFGYSLDAPRNTYLRDAIVSSLTDRAVLISATIAPGCLLEPSSLTANPSEITYHRHISRLLQRHCVECHREGGVGPFTLETYQEAVAHAPMIRQVIDRGVMPPWFAAPEPSLAHSPWINDRSLCESEKKQILDWISNKMPAGDAQETPAPRKFTDGWLIGKPDAVYEFEKPIKIKATGTMPYQNVVVDTHLDEERWVQAIEVRPGNAAVVHHVLVFAQSSEETDQARDDAADERGGYWGIYVPGNSTLIYPEGYAKRIPKGARLRFQMHYTPNGTATQDSTRIGLVFAKEAPKHEIRVAGIANTGFRIPPGAENHSVVGSIKRVPADVQVLAFLPHMHLRGKAARFELISDGSTKTLLDIPRYDFNWQLLYRYAEPLSVKAGDTLQFTAWYDNSKGNPANPDPDKEVRWGPQTFDEMHLGYVEYIESGSDASAESAEDSKSGPAGRNPLSARNRIREAVRGALGGAGSGRKNVGETLFRQLDVDENGKVSRDEVKAKYQNNPAASTTIFDRLDKDKDGQLTIEEMRELARVIGR